MVEKNLQSIFTKWVREHPEKVLSTTVWELKLEKGNAFAFNRLAEHQITSLLQAKNGGLYHKISDTPVSWGGEMRFTHQKPLDCMLIRDAKAYLVLCFYKLRQKKKTLWIDVDRFIRVRNESKRKSLTEMEAELIAERIEII